MFFGFFGAHRTGKSTLAAETARQLDLPFIQTNVSKTLQQLGSDPQADIGFGQRLIIQNQILESLADTYDEACSKHPNSLLIVDRTPLDVLAYTQSEVLRQTLGNMAAREAMDRHEAVCWAMFNNMFAGAMLVQPGLPLIADPSKAPAERHYQEHVAALALQLAVGPRREIPVAILPRNNLELQSRVTDAKLSIHSIITQREQHDEPRVTH